MSFLSDYKSEIFLAVLILYVLTLALGVIGDRCLRRRTHYKIAADEGVCARLLYSHLINVRWLVGEADVAQYRAELLCKAGEIEHRGALVFQVGSHGDQGADGDNAGAADTGHQQVVRPLERLDIGPGQVAIPDKVLKSSPERVIALWPLVVQSGNP